MIDRLDESLSDALARLGRAGSLTRTEPRTDGGSPEAGESSTDSAGESGDGSDSSDGWRAVDSPTARALHAVVHGQDGAYACGEGGVLLRQTGDGWRVILERGPGVASNTLRDIAATADGCRLWFAGDSGALGYYDVADGHLSDYSAPMEKTSTWEAIAVSGKTGEERVRIANGSGEVLDCTVDGGCPEWGEVVKPGGGSTIPGTVAGPDGFYAVDTSGGVYREPTGSDAATAGDASGSDDTETNGDGSDRWERIGIRNAQVDFHDIWASESAVFVAGGDGIAYRYDPACENWTPLHVGEGALRAIRSRGSERVAVATGGRIYDQADGVRWAELDTPTEESLTGLALARSGEDVEEGLATAPVDAAVGAGGVILERDPPADGS